MTARYVSSRRTPLLNKQKGAVLVLLLAAIAAAIAVLPAYSHAGEGQGSIQWVLLTSINGKHAVDFETQTKRRLPYLAVEINIRELISALGSPGILIVDSQVPFPELRQPVRLDEFVLVFHRR